MSYVLNIVLQKKAGPGDDWVEIPTKWNEFNDSPRTIYWNRKEGYPIFDFLGLEEELCPFLPMKGIPAHLPHDAYDDISSGTYAFNYLDVKQLLEFDYDKEHVDPSYTEPNRGISIREWLGPTYFTWLEKLKSLGVVRIVYSIG